MSSGGDSDFLSTGPPSITGGASMESGLPPSLLAAAAAAATSEASGYGDEEDAEDEITDETPFLQEQRRKGWRRFLPGR